MRVAALLAVVALCVLAARVSCVGVGRGTLVVLEDEGQRETHGRLLAMLQGAGLEVTVLLVGEDMTLVEYGEAAYDNVLLFLPEADDTGSNVDAEVVSQFVDLGNNLFLVAGPNSQEFVQELVNEVGGGDLEEGTLVSDHFNVFQPLDDGTHTTIVANNFVDAPIITGPNPAPVVYRGTGISLDSGNELVLPVLRAADTAYTFGESKKKQLATFLRGNRVTLVSALQARNGARVAVVAGPDMLSDAFFDAEIDGSKCGNAALAENLLLWTFRQKGVLRARNVHFAKAGEERAPEDGFRIKDDLTFQLEISQWAGDQWVPFSADDVQVEFRMLHPYERRTLKDEGNGTFSVAFRAPDVYGSFHFAVDYHRVGFNRLVVKAPVPVRPFAHDEYDRFIFMAYPYYLGVGTLMFSFFLFCAFFLFGTKADTLGTPLTKTKKD